MQEREQPGGGPGRPPEHDGVVGWDRTAVDGLLVRGPLLFYGAILTGDGTGAATAIIYDGRDTNGRRFTSMLGGTAAPGEYLLRKPVLFGTGIYVDIGVKVADVLVFYVPLKG